MAERAAAETRNHASRTHPHEATLVCPHCRAALRPGPDGLLCDSHGLFPRHGRLVSFLPGEVNLFDRHWEKARSAQRPATKVQVARRFLRPLMRAASAAAPLDIIDIGCGDGIHIQEMLAADPAAFRISGVDYSAGALASAMAVPGDWLPVHADASRLPFADASFDAAISFGVLALLEDHQKGLAEAVRVVRPGGMVGVWYAPRRYGVAGLLLRTARATVPRMPSWMQSLAANMLVPFLGLMPTVSTLSLRNGTWAECREVILVNLTPERVAYPTRAELEAAFARLGCEIVTPADAVDGEFWLRRKSQTEMGSTGPQSAN